MRADEYEAWYRTARGEWIGRKELALLATRLQLQPRDRVLDVGAGTGWFSRRLAAHADVHVTALDPAQDWLRFARQQASANLCYVAGRAESLPFPDAAFDVTISIAALCFIAAERVAVAELVRVTRRRLGLGLLNRRSLLWRAKGRDGGQGGYRGAHWHTCAEAQALFHGLPVERVRCRTAVTFPTGSRWARLAEHLVPAQAPWGGFLLVVADVSGSHRASHAAQHH